MLLAFAAASFGQQMTPKQQWTATEYYEKSKRQKTAAWVLLGTGIALFTGGLIAHYSEINNNQDDPYAELSELTFFTAGEVIATIGALSAGGSIPLFIVSSRNKKKAKAASAFIEMKKAHVLQGTVFSNQSFPAVGVKIHL